MSSPSEDALAALEATQSRLDALPRGMLTLDPRRERATPLRAVVEAHSRSQALGTVVAEGLVALVEAQLDAFPGNLLWDYDLLVASAVTAAAGSATPELEARERLRRLAALNALYGRDTQIRFRYVHDFVYGFDWAKWVRRDPATRDGVGPFDPPFLEYSHRRAEELLGLIAVDDAKYPRLRDARHRNPFSFSREPDDELRLHRHLAAEGLVPVEAWRADATPRWDRPYADLRREAAAALGLARVTAR